MKKLLSVAIVLFATFLLNQTLANPIILKGKKASEKVKNAIFVRYNDRSPLPQLIRFDPRNPLPSYEFTTWIRQFFKNGNTPGFNLLKVRRDKYGFTHKKYQEIVNGYPIQFGVVQAHIRNGYVSTYSGELYPTKVNTATASISEKKALQNALNLIQAKLYKWEIPSEEKHIKTIKNDPTATFYPKGELVYIYKNNKPGTVFRLAYRFDIYAANPISHQKIWIDAQTGQLLYKEDLIHNSNEVGSAQTLYSGTQTITTDKQSANQYRLQEANRAGGADIYTLDMNHGTNYGNAQDITNSSNSWSAEAGTDAHWASEEVIDFYWNKFGRNSLDGSGMSVYSYVHYDNQLENAYWDGYEMSYGDGDNNATPFVALDIAGHEMTHGVVQYTSNFSGSTGEPAALNESFADIFGNTIEHYAKPADASWNLGDDIGFTVRNMANPNSQNKPDTYEGNYWNSAGYGEPHYWGCPHDYMYYLMVEGGSGTNDNNDSYNVTGIGWDDAIAIVYKNLTTYLSSNSDYADARAGAIQAATDLFGACSQQVITTTNAFYAIGVGNVYSGGAVTANFIASPTSGCAVPFSVTFSNTSTGGTGATYNWDFGDGSTSTQENPTHTYTNFGQYTVQLTATPASQSCGSDDEVKANYIDVNAANSCFSCDTINYPLPGTPAVYSSSNGGYMAGWNGYGDIAKANKFSNYGTYTHVTGALIGFYGVYDSGSGAQVQVTIWNDNAGSPGAVLDTVNISLLELENDLTLTGGTHQGVIQFTFPNPVAVSSPYYLGIKMVGFTANDSLGLISNSDGDSPTNLAWEQEDDDSWHDMAQNWGTTSLDLYVSPIMTETPPSAVATSDQSTICAGGTITFDGSTSQNIANGGYYWAFPNGASIASSTDSVVSVTFATAGTYNAILYAVGGCSGMATDSVQFTVNPSPTITVANTTDPATCGGNGTIELTLTGISNGNYTINYDAGSFSNVTVNNGSATITAPAGSYNNLTISNGSCTSLSGVNASLSDPGALAQPTINTNPASCSADGSASVGNYTSGYNYTFNPSGPSVDGSGNILNATAGTNYTIASNSGGCSSSSASFTIPTQLNAPTLTISNTTDPTSCGGNGTIDLSFTGISDGTYTINYSSGSFTGVSVSGGSATISAANGTYSNLTISDGTCSSASGVSATLNGPTSLPNPVVDLVAASCSADGSASLSNYNNSYSYSFSPSGPSVNTLGEITGTSAGTNYTITASNIACSSNDINFTVPTQLNNPSISVSSTNDPAICGDNGSITLSFTGISDGTYSIDYDNGTFSNVNVSGGSATIVAPAGTYGNLVISDGTCPSATGISASITDPNAPDMPIINTSAATCSADGSANISNYDGVNNTYTFSPSGPSISATGDIINATTGVAYTVSSSLGSCSSAGSSFTIAAQIPTPNVTASATNLNLCEGDSTTISAGGADTYTWDQSLGTDASYTVAPNADITYTVTGTTNGCSATAAITISVQATVNISISAPQTIACDNGSVTITASGATNYTWNNGLPNGSSQTVSPTTATTYVVTGTTNGCSDIDSVTISVGTSPSVLINASQNEICEGENTVLSASGATSYTWSPSGSLNTSTGNTVIASPTSFTTYQVVGTNDCGTSTQTIDITVDAAPSVPTITQTGNTLSVTLAAGESAKWYHNTVLVGTDAQLSITETGNYNVVVTNANGCSAQATGNFTFTAGIIKNITSLLKVYPNPTSGMVTISWDGINKVKTIQVFDMIGNKVIDDNINKGENKKVINLSSFGKGIYMIRLVSESNTITRKVTKQ